ncbi:MAG: hypothetical protein CL928_12775 [Deltaproteobacteria bacterium]|nr:hypothetical protein [Deltaproteobacteria bacterium]
MVESPTVMRRAALALPLLLLPVAYFAGCAGGGEPEASDGSSEQADASTETSTADRTTGSSNLQGPEDCGNQKDDDGDGKVDCKDDECGEDPACSTTPENSGDAASQGPEDCDNGQDDDGDGKIDCLDSACSSDPACGAASAGDGSAESGGPKNCSDRKDDDGDGLIDCKDPDCAEDSACQTDAGQDAEGAMYEDCGNQLDEDGDGKTDCDDTDCKEDPACNQEDGGDGEWSPADLSGVPEGLEQGQRAPDFELPYIGRTGTQKLSGLRGQIVLITFWASWCGPCRLEVPALELTWQLYKEQEVTVIGISVDEKPRFANEFLGIFPVSYPMLLDKAGAAVAGPWKVSSIPVTVLLDRNGVVVERRMGYTPRQLRTTITRIDELLRTP